MNRNQYSSILVLITILFAPGLSYSKRFDFNRDKIGGNFRLIFYAPYNFKATEAATMAFALVDSLDEVLSNYKENSDVSRLNAQKILEKPSNYFLEVIKLSQMAYNSTNGYFDISIRPLMKEWNKAERKKRLPKKRHLQNVKKSIGLTNVFHITPENNLWLKKRGSLDIGGIAKGYIIDKVYDFLLEKDVPAFLVEAAGDIRVFGKPEGKKSWTVGVSSNSYSVISVELKSGQAIATSGKTYRYRIIEGKQYSHIIDPKTLTPVLHNITSSVVSSSATEADYLASAFNIAFEEPERSEILRKHGEAKLLLLNKRSIIFQSDFFPIKTQTK